MQYILLMLVAISMMSCTTTKGLEEIKEFNTTINIKVGAGGLAYFQAPIDTDRQSGDQTSPTTSRIDPQTDLALSMPKGGSTSVSKAGEGMQVLEQLSSLLDKRKKDSENTTTTTTEVAPVPVIKADETKVPVNPEEVLTNGDYQTEFQHTTADAGHGGTSLKLCPNQVMDFDSCKAGDTDLPRHDSDGQEGYWNMTDVSTEDIVCTKGAVVYKYPGGKEMVKGDCK